MGCAPRTAHPILPKEIEGLSTAVKGVLFLGGTYQDLSIDPVIARAVTDVTGSGVEPGYFNLSWAPQIPFVLNELDQEQAGLSQVLVTLGAQ